MKVTISATWLRLPWSMPTWDAAYAWLVKAGKADLDALKEIGSIKVAAKAGHPQAVQVKRCFDVVAQLVAKGLPKPSVFVAQHRRKSPLLPGGGARTATTAQQAALLKRQQEQIKALKRQQIERAQKERLHKQVQARFAAEKAAHEAELQQYEDKLAMTEKVLERRDLADEMRAKLEAQAEQYEAVIEKLKTPAAAGEPATVSEAAAAEQPEAQQDDAAEAYPSGAPGDVEFNDAGA